MPACCVQFANCSSGYSCDSNAAWPVEARSPPRLPYIGLGGICSNKPWSLWVVANNNTFRTQGSVKQSCDEGEIGIDAKGTKGGFPRELLEWESSSMLTHATSMQGWLVSSRRVHIMRMWAFTAPNDGRIVARRLVCGYYEYWSRQCGMTSS